MLSLALTAGTTSVTEIMAMDGECNREVQSSSVEELPEGYEEIQPYSPEELPKGYEEMQSSPAEELSENYEEVESSSSEEFPENYDEVLPYSAEELSDSCEEVLLSSPEDLPESYDLRDLGLVTPVKKQDPWGTCWAFGGIAAAESSLLTAMGATYEETGLDLSERHIAWYTRQPLPEGICASQTGEGYYPIDENSSPNDTYECGAGSQVVGSFWAAGRSPALESDYPYQGNGGLLEHDVLTYHKDEWISQKKEELRKEYSAELSLGYITEEDIDAYAEEEYEASLASCSKYDFYSSLDDWSLGEERPQESEFVLTDNNVFEYRRYDSEIGYVTDPETVEAMKRELMEGHALNMTYYASNKAINKETWAFYQGTAYTPNHSCCIVGWDDNYAVENFKNEPPAAGAWLVKNSYGSETDAIPGALVSEDGTLKNANEKNWGITDEEGRHTGYFWISYYDRSMRDVESFRFEARPNTDLTDALQYDYIPASEIIGDMTSSSESSMANIYPVDHDLCVTDIGTRVQTDKTYLVGDYNVSFTLYRLNEGAVLPTDGTQIAAFERHFSYAGYHRVRLNDPVYLREGERLAVVVTIRFIDGNGNVSYSCPAANFFTKKNRKLIGATDYAEVTVNPGESFLYIEVPEGGEARWIDLAEPMGEDFWNMTKSPWDTREYDNQTIAETENIDNFCIKVFTEPGSPEPISIESASVAGVSKSYGYSGKAYTPAVTVTVNGETLEENVDYTVQYDDNIKPGTATVTITGMGDYTGTRIKTFEIVDCASKIVSGKTYQLIPKNNSSTAVCPYSGKMVNNTKVYITDRSASEAMRFKAVQNGDGTWKFINSKCELALAVQQNSSIAGKGLVLYDQTTREAQNWKLSKKYDNSFAIINAVSGHSIAMSDASAVKGTTLSIEETRSDGLQRFYIVETDEVKAEYDGTKSIRASKDKKFAMGVESSSKADGANINLTSYSNTNAKKFRFMYSGGGYYRLVNANSGMCLTVKGNTKANGANVIQAKWAAESGQRWKISKNADGTVTLTNALGTILHLNGNKTANGTNIAARTPYASKAQCWYLQDAG